MSSENKNVFKEYEQKIITTEAERLKRVQYNLNESKETLNHISNISETFTTRLFSTIGNFLGKK